MKSEFHSATILTLKEAAASLKVCVKTILRLIERHDIKAFKVGRQWRIRVSAILEYQTRYEEDFLAEGQTR
jgi:excisionase family DNA binding protein